MISSYEESNGRWSSQRHNWMLRTSAELCAWGITVFQGARSSCARWAGTLIFAIAFGAMLSSVMAETEGDYTYSVIDNQAATITKYNGPGGDVVIPNKLGGYPVTKIEGGAFWGKNNLASVVIPGSVTSIGYQAFGSCRALISVVIPDSVTSIEALAFGGCSSLASVVIPGSVTDIGELAFELCSSLTRVEIPASVNNIGAGAFSGCSKLVDIAVEAAHPAYSSVQGILFDKNQKTLVQYPAGKRGRYQIPDTVTVIAASAFGNCSSLTGVEIPGSVTNIGAWAFSGCTSLTGLVIPGSVASIEKCTFYGCSGLVTVVISNGVTHIGESAFSHCTTLVNVEIPDSMIDIAHGAFYDCTSLTSIVIPDRVERFGNRAFYGCTSLASVKLGASVEAIGSNAFFGCTSLTSIVIPDQVFAIDFSAFAGCTSLVSVVIPDRTFSIGQDAFSGCTSLTELVIPDNVNSIGKWAFYGCTSLTSMVLPEKVRTIKEKTFYGCTNLTSVVMKNTRDQPTIEESAFEGCENLADIYFASSPPELKNPNEFDGCPCTVHYVAGTAGWVAQYAGRPTKIWTVKIAFDGSGGIPTELERTYNAGVPCGFLPAANHPDFQFAGWWMEDGITQIDAATPAPLVAGGCTLYAAYSYEHPLHIGWNLISAKLNLIEKSQKELLNKGVMTLDANSMLYVFSGDLAASQACWIYCHEAEEITLLGTPPEVVDFEASLKPGWNFVGPLNDHNLSTPGAVAWGWDDQHFYSPANRLLVAGRGYWIYRQGH